MRRFIIPIQRCPFVLLIGLPLTSLCFFPLPAVTAHQQTAPEGRSVRVVGVASGTDKAIARDEAIKDALRKAVEEAVGVLVDSRTVVENSQLLEDNIYTKSKGYARSYMIVSEEEREGLYRVTINAVVAQGEIGKDLENLADQLRLGSNPRLLVILDGDNKEAITLAESAVSEPLLDKGFKVVDPLQAVVARLRSENSFTLSGEPDAALRRRLMPVADIIITGTISVSRLNNVQIGDTSLFAASARLDLRAIHVDTGEVFARSSVSKKGLAGGSPDNAAEKALKEAAKSWFDKNLAKLIRAGIDPARTVQVNVAGLSLSQLSDLSTTIRAMRFVRHVRMRDREGDVAQMEIEWVGDAQALAVALEKINTIRLTAFANTANTIQVKAK